MLNLYRIIEDSVCKYYICETFQDVLDRVKENNIEEVENYLEYIESITLLGEVLGHRYLEDKNIYEIELEEYNIFYVIASNIKDVMNDLYSCFKIYQVDNYFKSIKLIEDNIEIL